jgi:hypothetical protein
MGNTEGLDETACPLSKMRAAVEAFCLGQSALRSWLAGLPVPGDGRNGNDATDDGGIGDGQG